MTDQQHQQHQQPGQPKSQEFVKSLGEFFQRDLISMPLIKKHPLTVITQRCGLKAATLELDTSAFPNIEYIAGNRLSIYPVNPIDHVNLVVKHLVDDIGPSAAGQQRQKKLKMSEPWAKFVQLNGKESVRLALTYLYDITTAPSRDLLRLMAECCTNKEHKSKLIVLSRTDEVWEKWVCQSLRTLKSTLEEFSSCSISAKSLFSELTLQQPRQYSLSTIKSSKRFRTEIIVFQHKFTAKQIASSLQNIKEREQIQQQDGKTRSPAAGSSSGGGGGGGVVQLHPTTVHVNINDSASQKSSSSSVRSLRSVVAYNTSPITTQQVKRVPSFSGPLMSMYAASSTMNSSRTSSAGASSRQSQRGTSKLSSSSMTPSQVLGAAGAAATAADSSSSSQGKQYDGLCSNYLLNLTSNDHIVCEFVENPRFTLKGGRERPIMMIGQDVGVVAFRPFWQQRTLEHDRAQMFYSIFKDLTPRKFGDMQLVCLTGNRCKVEELFKREINAVLTHKIMSSASYINKSNLVALLDTASISSQLSASGGGGSKLPIDANKELMDLGNRISKLLVENNGCLYTCCDPQMTQAIEILVVESVTRNSSLSRERIMALLPKWKGRKLNEQALINNKFLFTLENPFEKAQIVQEIYDSSI